MAPMNQAPEHGPKRTDDNPEDHLSKEPDNADRIIRIVAALIPGAIAGFMLAKLVLLLF